MKKTTFKGEQLWGKRA